MRLKVRHPARWFWHAKAGIFNRAGASQKRGLEQAASPHEQAWGSRAIVDKPGSIENPVRIGRADEEPSSRGLVSVLYATGQRPAAAAVEALARRGTFSISLRPMLAEDETGPNWLELLATGLTFDLRGLEPGAAVEAFQFVHRYGLGTDPVHGVGEAVSLAVGPHLAGAEGLLPVVRAAATLAMELAALPGAVAVGWRPARALSGAGHFTTSVSAWLAGGVFPALGLTVMSRASDGAMTSEGLALMTGQELWLAPTDASQPAVDARLAVRLIDRLVSLETLRTTLIVEPIPGQKVRLEPDHSAKLVRARRIEG